MTARPGVPPASGALQQSIRDPSAGSFINPACVRMPHLRQRRSVFSLD